MRRALAISLLVLNLLLPTTAFSQQVSQQNGNELVVSLPQGGFAAFKIEVSPLNLPSSSRKQSGILPPFVSRVVTGEGNALHRMLVDEQGRFVFVYDLVITEFESPKRFAVSARALDLSYEQTLRADNPSAFQIATNSSLPTLARATEQQTVADGETVALDLLINEPLGVKVVDYVTVASERSLLSPGRPSRPARDFGVYNVELAIRNYQLYVDKQPLVTSGLRNCNGAMVWFHLPGRGRFIFSLVPYDGYDFQKVGVIEDRKISFTWKGVSYEWVSREPIVGSGGLWNLWVLHDEDFVDIFAPAEASTLRKTNERGTLIRKPVGVLAIPIPKNSERTTLESHRSLRNQSTERIRVVIGGAKSIDALLPRK
ncbi:MAG: hypothetical protein ND895_00195 [Pyrinomonadaceae bacterium]|nr:hypothetical protein [Pyrinomonadaceae bacterium]